MQRVSWHGTQPNEPDWTGQRRSLAFQLHGRPPTSTSSSTPRRSRRDSHCRRAVAWKRLVDTNLPSPDDVVEERDAVPLRPADHYFASARSAVILMAHS